MAETLGTLADKLITVKLKLWHTDDAERIASLKAQEKQLEDEINEFVGAALAGEIPVERLTFASNKVYKKEGNAITDFSGSIGELFAQLAETNCKLWHVQEKVYEFEQVAPEQKDQVVRELAVVNLERNQCIDRLDQEFQKSISTQNFDKSA
jgi:hypothetical protein